MPAVPSAPPASLGAIATRVDARMLDLLDAELERWTAVDADLAEPLTALRDFVATGGKRLRPAFCHWGFVAAGGDPDDHGAADRVADAGGALELLHTMAVIHDDVMDDSRQRRGADAVHVTFEARHRRAGWRGEGRRFGEGVATLVGDLAFVYADALLQRARPSRNAVDVFTELRVEVNVGQYLDLLNGVRGGTAPDAARRICVYKSAKYTVERPLHLGAALAGRLTDVGPALSAYGLPVGEAFQLVDDLLGAFGDEAETGKPVGGDLREGKPTLLAAIAAERATGADRGTLDRYGSPDLTADEVTAIQRVLERTGARGEVEARVDRLVADGVAALDGAGLAPEARDALTDLARFVAARRY